MEPLAIAAAEWVVNVMTLYIALGVAFAGVFVLSGINRLDPVARNSGFGFRLMILPGIAALWPLLVAQWIRNRGAPR